MILPEPESLFKTLIPVRDDLLQEMETEALEEDIRIVGPVEGRLLHVLARLTGARRILEMGTATGYSAIHLASALPREEGRLVCLEQDPAMIERARKNLEQAGLFNLVEIVPGPALETAKSLTGPFDLIFLDIVKTDYPKILDSCHRLLRNGGLLIADNTAHDGTQEFTAALLREPGWLDVHLLAFLPGHAPPWDGISLAVKMD